MEEQHFFALDTGTGDHRREHDDLVDMFAGYNDLKPGRAFCLSALVGEGSIWGAPATWPGDDHTVYLRRYRRPAMVLAQPYETSDVERLKTWAAERGLIISMPPNPFASFWFPGWTYCVAITAPDFGEVKWLPAQLEFQWQGRVL